MTGESMSGTDPRVELTREFFGGSYRSCRHNFPMVAE